MLFRVVGALWCHRLCAVMAGVGTCLYYTAINAIWYAFSRVKNPSMPRWIDSRTPFHMPTDRICQNEPPNANRDIPRQCNHEENKTNADSMPSLTFGGIVLLTFHAHHLLFPSLVYRQGAQPSSVHASRVQSSRVLLDAQPAFRIVAIYHGQAFL